MPETVTVPASIRFCPAPTALSPATVKLATAPTSTVAKLVKVVSAMLPDTVTFPPANRLVGVPVPEARSSVPPSPSTDPTNADPAFTAAKATFALNPGVWLRLVRLVMVSPVQRHHRRSQAETPLIPLSRFPRPALSSCAHFAHASSRNPTSRVETPARPPPRPTRRSSAGECRPG